MNQVKQSTAPQAKPKVRLAQVDDFAQVYPLFKKMNNERLTRDDWFRLFENHWSIDEFSPGMVLQADDKIVGYIGTIYSRQTVLGKAQLFCNLSTWIVEDDYRSYSIMMIFSLVRKKNLVLTSFSSNAVTYEVYKKLGFVDGNRSKRIVYPLPFFQSAKYRIITDIEQIKKTISRQNKSVFFDHFHFGNAYALVKYQNEECLLMGVNREQLLRLFYASDREFLQCHLKYFHFQLMKHFQAKRMHIDEQLLNGCRLFLSRKVTWGRPYQYKSSLDAMPSPSAEYSELFLLNM